MATTETGFARILPLRPSRQNYKRRLVEMEEEFEAWEGAWRRRWDDPLQLISRLMELADQRRAEYGESG